MQESDPGSIEECDVRIAWLQAETRRVKSIRNSYSPISRLPTEVLCKIFICLRNASHVGEYHEPLVLRYVKITTHVCRHWRITAIDLPELWSLIAFNVPLKWVKLQRQRAKKSPLDVMICPRSWRDRDADTFPKALQIGTMLRSCSSQLRTLKIIRAEYVDIERYEINLRGVPWAFLERLKISMYDMDTQETELLPASIFATGTPSLRHLSLRGIILPFTSPLFQGLCSLSLMTLYHSTISLPQFLDALDSSPGLEKLKVEFEFSEHLPYTPRPQAVTLPKIKSFQLNATMSNCTAIVKHLMLPISAIIKIIFLHSDPRVISNPLPMHEEFCAAIQQAWSSNPLQTGNESVLPSIHSMGLECDGNKLYLRFWLDDRQSFLTRLDGKSSFEESSFDESYFGESSSDESSSDESSSDKSYFGESSFKKSTFDESSDPTEPRAALELYRHHQGGSDVQPDYLVKYLPIENVTSVIIEGKSLVKQLVWSRLSELSSLAYLSLGGNSANSFFTKALSGPDPATGINRFPCLTHISFYDVDFGLARYHGHRLPKYEYPPVHFDEQLMEFLRLRKHHDTSIQKLCFESCTNFTKESFEAVTKLVGDVDWDGAVTMKDRLR